ncbi:sensor histidine kinase [Emticicia agri]|nr:HAMP domain-containing sensor histidine kinase [Emticicia agri]
MNKLLNKPLKAFTMYALLILALSIPVYYWVIDSIWLNEIDVHNQTIEGRIKDGFKNIPLTENEITHVINVWSQIQPGVKISAVSVSNIRKDSVYETIRPNTYANETYERFRGRSTYFYIHNKPYHLSVETNVEETHETVIAIATVTAVFFVLLLLGFVLLNRKIAQQIWQPFRNTLNQLKIFDLNSQKPIKLDPTTIEEFEELNEVLRKLIANNIDVYNQQKQFTENASHELQTPLALLKSKIDLLLQDKTLSKTQLESITALNIPLSRVSRINKNLLLLAKIENHQYPNEETIDLNQILNENIDILSDYASTGEISIDNGIKEPVMVKANRHLIEIMLTNLLVNGIRHNLRNGILAIDYQASTLMFSNSGTSPLNEDTLFKRFVSASTQSPNSGLGLAIVKEICHLYGWKVSYRFEKNFHHFSVSFS